MNTFKEKVYLSHSFKKAERKMAVYRSYGKKRKKKKAKLIQRSVSLYKLFPYQLASQVIPHHPCTNFQHCHTKVQATNVILWEINYIQTH